MILIANMLQILHSATDHPTLKINKCFKNNN